MMSNFTEIKCSCGAGAPASKRIPFIDGDYYLCDDKRCKQKLELEIDKAEFAKSFQGKSKQSYDTSLIVIMTIGALGWITLLVYWGYCLLSK